MRRSETGAVGSDSYRPLVFWLLFGLVSYIALFYTAPYPYFSVPLFLGLTLGASLPSGPAAAVAAGAWALGTMVAPPQVLFWQPMYNEAPLVALLNQTHPYSWTGALGGLILAPATAALSRHALEWNALARQRLSCLLLTLVMINFVAAIASVSPQVIAQFRQEPADKSYYFDGVQQLKAFHLHKQGLDYYTAFRKAMEADLRPIHPETQSLRPPLLYWTLALLPNPGWLPPATWLLSVVAMTLAFAVCWQRGDPVASLAAPLLMAAYLVYPESNTWMMTSEVQGSITTLLAMAGYCLGGWRVGIPLLGFGILIREWSAIPFGLSVLLGGKNKSSWALGLTLLVVVGGLYYWHSSLTRAVVGLTHTVPVSSRLDGGVAFAFSTLRFGTVYLAGRDLVMPLLGLLALLAPVWLRQDRAVWLLSLSGASLFALFHVVGFEWGSYYGFAYVPLVLWAAGLSLARGVKE